MLEFEWAVFAVSALRWMIYDCDESRCFTLTKYKYEKVIHPSKGSCSTFACALHFESQFVNHNKFVSICASIKPRADLCSIKQELILALVTTKAKMTGTVIQSVSWPVDWLAFGF